MVQKRLVANWSGFGMPFEYQTAQPFEYMSPVSGHSLKPTIRKPNFKKVGIQMFPVFKWSVFRSPLYSDNIFATQPNFRPFKISLDFRFPLYSNDLDPRGICLICGHILILGLKCRPNFDFRLKMSPKL